MHFGHIFKFILINSATGLIFAYINYLVDCLYSLYGKSRWLFF